MQIVLATPLSVRILTAPILSCAVICFFLICSPLLCYGQEDSASSLVSRRSVPIGEVDFLQYWSATKLFVAQQNPYDPELLAKVQRTAQSSPRDVIIMWNPPWILPLVGVVGFFEAQQGVVLWFIASSLLYVIIVNMLSDMFRCETFLQRAPMYVVAIVFPPLISALSHGQISVVLLLGWVLLLRASAPRADSVGQQRSNVARSYWGILGVYLTSCKPHLLYIPYIFLTFVRWRLMLGAGVVVLTVVSALSLWNSTILFDYYAAVTDAPPFYWKTPTLGTFLQWYFDDYPAHVTRLVVHGLGVMALLAVRWCYRHLNVQQTLLLLAPLSMFFNSYGWIYDQMLLLPTVCYLLAFARSAGFGRLALLCTCMVHTLYLFTAPTQQSGFWYPMVVSIAAMLALRSKEKLSHFDATLRAVSQR